MGDPLGRQMVESLRREECLPLPLNSPLVIYINWLFFRHPPPPPAPTSHKHEFFGLTSGFTRLILNTKYVCHGIISRHVNFHDTRTKWTVTSSIKICRWGEKEKEPINFVYLSSNLLCLLI